MNILSPSSKIEPLIVEGQCVFIFNHICKKNIKVYFYDKSNINGLKVVISNSNVLTSPTAPFKTLAPNVPPVVSTLVVLVLYKNCFRLISFVVY